MAGEDTAEMSGFAEYQDHGERHECFISSACSGGHQRKMRTSCIPILPCSKILLKLGPQNFAKDTTILRQI